MRRNRSSSELAAALGVSAGTISYHARRGELPFDTTPGGHRRYDIDEVRAVLAGRPSRTALAATPAFGALALSDEDASAQLSESAALELAATAGGDERADMPAGDRLPADPMDVFARPGIVRYPTSAHGVGAGA